jgi:DNA-binding PadR family transcriptional regulator
LIELAVLGLLRESDLHGYELRRRLKTELGTFFSISFGSLYPTLKRLLKEGDVEEVRETAIYEVPLTGSLSAERSLWKAFGSSRSDKRLGKGKRVYRITPKGKELLQELLLSTASDNDEARNYCLKIAFAKYLEPNQFLHLIEDYREFLNKKIVECQKALEGPSVDQYKTGLKRRSLVLLETELNWLKSFEQSIKEKEVV